MNYLSGGALLSLHTVRGINTVRGGEAVAQGSYGCVFRPALVCKDRPGREPNAVSKLMYPDNAQEEFKESNLVRAALGQGFTPKEMDLFIIPLQPPCVPAPLTADDLKNVWSACSTFSAFRGLREPEGKYRVLNLRDGGQGIEMIRLNHIPRSQYSALVMGLIPCLRVIRRVNLRGVIHGDLKANNMAFNATDNTVRMIDWGFVRFIQKEYSQSFFDTPTYMFNVVPSLMFYKVAAGLLDVKLDPASIAQRVYAVLDAAKDQTHLVDTDHFFTACTNARALCSLPPIAYNIAEFKQFAPLGRISRATQDLLMAHGVALMRAIFTSDRNVVAQKRRFAMLVDLVLRVNADTYGILAMFKQFHNSRCTFRRTYALATIAPYVMSASYAVAPYNLDYIFADLARIADAKDARDCPAETSDLAVNVNIEERAAAYEAQIDPRRQRVLPYTDALASMGRTLTSTQVKNLISQSTA